MEEKVRVWSISHASDRADGSDGRLGEARKAYSLHGAYLTDSMITEVIVDPIEVVYVEAKGGLAGVPQAWSELEARLSSLKGRKMYGAFHPRDGVYRACMAIIDEGEPGTLGLPMWTIPGGKFARDRVRNWTGNVEKIGEAFESMAHKYKADPGRWSIEFYRSQEEIVLLLPLL